MTRNAWILSLILIAFSAYTGYVLVERGYLDVPMSALRDISAGQVFLDLTIACGLIGVWMIKDTEPLGGVRWLYIIAIPFLGSLAILPYLIHREIVLKRRAST